MKLPLDFPEAFLAPMKTAFVQSARSVSVSFSSALSSAFRVFSPSVACEERSEKRETQTDALRKDEDERDDERAYGSIFVRSVFVLSVVTRRVP